jgi:hypothetical protein
VLSPAALRQFCRLIHEAGLPTKLAHAMHRAQRSSGGGSSELLASALTAAALRVSAWPASCQQLSEAGALMPLAGVLASAAQRACWPAATEAAWNVLELHPASRLLPAVEIELKVAPIAAAGAARGCGADDRCSSLSSGRKEERAEVAGGSPGGALEEGAAGPASGSRRSSSPGSSGPHSPPLYQQPAASAPEGWQLLALSCTPEQQAQRLAAAICPLYSRLAAPAASQADQELANDLLVVAGYLGGGSALAAAALQQHGLVAETAQQAAALAEGQQPGLTHQTLGEREFSTGGWLGRSTALRARMQAACCRSAAGGSPCLQLAPSIRSPAAARDPPCRLQPVRLRCGCLRPGETRRRARGCSCCGPCWRALRPTTSPASR